MGVAVFGVAVVITLLSKSNSFSKSSPAVFKDYEYPFYIKQARERSMSLMNVWPG